MPTGDKIGQSDSGTGARRINEASSSELPFFDDQLFGLRSKPCLSRVKAGLLCGLVRGDLGERKAVSSGTRWQFSRTGVPLCAL